jgi:hypothetical protein
MASVSLLFGGDLEHLPRVRRTGKLTLAVIQSNVAMSDEQQTVDDDPVETQPVLGNQ